MKPTKKKDIPTDYPGKALYNVFRYFSFVSVIAFMFVLNIIDRTEHGMRLAWYTAFGGLVIGFVLTIFLWRKYDLLYTFQQANMHTVVFLSCIIFPVTAVNLINKYAANPALDCITYKVDEVTSTTSYTNGGRSSSIVYFLFINLDGKRERFEIPMSVFEKLHNGGNVKLYVQHGALGYDFVKKFEAVDW